MSNHETSLAGRFRQSIRTVITTVTAIVLATAGIFLGAAPAQATDTGGDGDPSGCANPITVATAGIYGSRAHLTGKKIGEVQLRWSWACHGNWSRVIMFGGMYSSPVTVEQVVESEGRRAHSLDFVRTGSNGTSAWTRYLRLANSQSPACARAWLSSDFDTLNFHTNGAHACA